MDDATTTVMQLRDALRAFVTERAWESYHSPKELAMAVAVEAGELAELFQWRASDEIETLLRQSVFRAAVADEMSDVLAFLAAMANRTGIDLASSFEKKMAQNRRRFPRGRCQGRYEHRPRRSK